MVIVIYIMNLCLYTLEYADEEGVSLIADDCWYSEMSRKLMPIHFLRPMQQQCYHLYVQKNTNMTCCLQDKNRRTERERGRWRTSGCRLATACTLALTMASSSS